ncbi:MAG: S1/P1 nuclease [Chthoniobacterales bacterium]
MHFRFNPGIFALACIFALLPAARAWDALGHMIVCQIAYENLTPTAKAAFDRRLADFNRKKKTQYLPAITGTYMDDIRDQTREYNPWHYINLPFTREGLPLPPPGEVNILWAIRKCVAIIDGKSTDSKIDRDEAMVMLTHLVADVHQPLHTTSNNNDLGGNKVIVPNLVDPLLEMFGSNGNLHWFWDMSYRATVDSEDFVTSAFSAPLYLRSAPVPGHLKAADLVFEKATEYQEKFPAATAGGPATPEEWISESHELGFDFAYGELPGGPDSNPVELDSSYVERATEISEKRLTLAGYRLAHLLNSILN